MYSRGRFVPVFTRLLSALVIVTLLLPPREAQGAGVANRLPETGKWPQPLGAGPAGPSQFQPVGFQPPVSGAGPAGPSQLEPVGFQPPVPVGSLRYSPDVDAGGDPATNPNALTPVPVSRVVATARGDAVRYALVALAVEAVPQIAARNPAGAIVEFHLRSAATGAELLSASRTDAWGAASAAFLLDEAHLAGRFTYFASADGYGRTVERSFTIASDSYGADLQLGAAQVSAAVAPDGRLAVEVRSDLPIDDADDAVQLLAVRLVATSTVPSAPALDALPPLVMPRADAQHARAGFYLDPGDYLLSATARSGTALAQSAPISMHVAPFAPPPIGRLEQVAEIASDGSSALAQYRTPAGDLALLRRALADLPRPEVPDGPRIFQDTYRVGAFRYQTSAYRLDVQSASDDGKKRISLDGFHYDPIARTYDIRIDSLLDQPVDDRVTVQVLGPNGVVIYEESAPFHLAPDKPFVYHLTVPADRGEPYGLHVTVHDPAVIDWILSSVGGAIKATFYAITGGLQLNFTVSLSLGFTLLTGLNIATLTLTCSTRDAADNPCPLSATGLVYTTDNWAETLLGNVRDYLVSRYQQFAGMTIDQIAEELLGAIPVGGFSVGIGAELDIDLVLIDPSKCPTPEALAAAKAYVAALGSALVTAKAAVNSILIDLGVEVSGLPKIAYPIPSIPPILKIKISLGVAFSVNAGATPNGNGIFAGAGFTLSSNAELVVMGGWLTWDQIKAMAKVLDIMRDSVFGVMALKQLVNVFRSAKTMRVTGGCPGDGKETPPPGGYPDDRRDAFQGGYLPPPTGVSGDLQYDRGQLATAERLGLPRAAAYYDLLVRQAEFNDFLNDTTQIISATQEINALADAAVARFQGLQNGAILPEPGQTITDALQATYDDFAIHLGNLSYDVQLRALEDALEFSRRQYQLLRGQELELQHELRELNQLSGIGVVDSGLVRFTLAAIHSFGADATLIQIVPGDSELAGPPYSGHYATPGEAPAVVIVPSGGLFRLRESQEAADWLRTYVAAGGTLIVLAQYEAADWEMLPGGQVQGLGYSEDILCKEASVQIVNASPWIIGLDHDRPDIQVDGSFTAWPGDATVVLLRTTGNHKPAMIEYSYGYGHVVATSAYPDWYVNGLQSQDDVVFARSLFSLAYLQATGQALVASAAAGAPLSFAVAVTNTSSLTATQITLYRDYYEVRLGESWRWAVHRPEPLGDYRTGGVTPPLLPGASTVVTFAFTAPPQAGIFRAGYFLGTPDNWAGSGVAGGPFYQVTSAGVPIDLFNFRLTPDRPFYNFGETATLTATLRNDRGGARTFVLQPLEGLVAGPVDVTVAAHETVSQVYTTTVARSHEVRLAALEDGAEVSQAVAYLTLRPPMLSLAKTPASLIVGVGADVTVTATALGMTAGAPLAWEVRANGALLAAATTPLLAGPGYTTAAFTAALPAADTDVRYTIGAALPNGAAITETVPVLPAAIVQQTSLWHGAALIIGQPTAGALNVTLADAGLPGAASLQALLRQGDSDLTAGAVATVTLGGGLHSLNLDLALPTTLDLSNDYRIVISATSQADAASLAHTEAYTSFARLPLAAPAVTPWPTVRTIRQPLTLDVTWPAAGVALPADATFDVALSGITTGYSYATAVTATASISNGLRLVLTIPDSVVTGGTYRATVSSASLTSWSASGDFYVPPAAFVYDVPASVNAGGSLDWAVVNAGGVDTALTGTLTLADPFGGVVAQSPVSVTLLSGAAYTVTFALPGQLATGLYSLRFQGRDALGAAVEGVQATTVLGLAVSLAAATDRDLYLPADPVTATAVLTANPALADASLRLQVLKPVDPSLPNAAVVALGPPLPPPVTMTLNVPGTSESARHVSADLEAQAARQRALDAHKARRNLTPPTPLSYEERGETAIPPSLAGRGAGGVGWLGKGAGWDAPAICTPPGSGQPVPPNPTGDVTWTAAGSPYVVDADVAIPAGATLTIESGAVVKFGPGASLIVSGTLVTPASGPAAVLTSIHDDTVGGDTNLAAVTPQAGDWGRIYLAGSAARTLRNLDVRYANRLESDGPVDVQNSVFTRLFDYVVVNSSGPSLIAYNTFDAAVDLGIEFTVEVTGARVLSNTFMHNVPSVGIWFQQTATDVQVIGNQWPDATDNTGIHFDFHWDMRPHSAITVTDNVFRNVVYDDRGCCAGVQFWGPAIDVLVARNVVQDVWVPNRGCCDGVDFWETAQDIVALDNEVRDVEPSDGGCCEGIDFWGEATGVILERNRFIRTPAVPVDPDVRSYENGIQFWSPASHVIGRDNYFDGAWGIENGFYFWDDAADVTLDGNQLLDNTRLPAGVFGDYGNSFAFWGRLQGFTLTNNIIVGGVGWDDTGMQFWNDLSDGIVADNRLENLTDPGNGIMVWSSAANVTFTHNSLANFGAYPGLYKCGSSPGLILFGDANNVQITHNTLRNFAAQYCDDEPESGIEIFGNQAITVTDNVLENVYAGAVIAWGNDVLIARNRIQGSYGKLSGIRIRGNRMTIVDNTVTDAGGLAGPDWSANGYNGIQIYFKSWSSLPAMSDVLIARNTLARLSGPGSGISIGLLAPGWGQNITVTENVVYDNPDGGIHLFGAFQNTLVSYNVSARNRFGLWLLGTADGITATSNTLAEANRGNVVLYSGLMNYRWLAYRYSADTILAPGGDIDYGPALPLLKNSILYAGAGYDVYGEGTTTISPTLRYNDAYSATIPGVTFDAGVTITPVATYDPTNFSADPRFVNAAAGDYRLPGDSPAIDAGDPAELDPGANSRIDLGALVGAAGVLREEWIAVNGGGVLTYPLALAAPDLLADPRARGRLELAATLFSRDPAGVAVENRTILAASSHPFLVADSGASVTLAAEQPTYRANVPGYAADDAAATVGLRGAVRNTAGVAATVAVTVTRSDGPTLFSQAFSDLASGESRLFAVSDPAPPAGVVTYTATTSLGDSATASVTVRPATAHAAAATDPTILPLGASTTLRLTLANTGAETAYVTADLGGGGQDVILPVGGAATLTRVVTPTVIGAASLPITLTGDLSQTLTAAITVRNDAALAGLSLTGELRGADTLVQSDDAGLALSLANTGVSAFGVLVDYAVSGPVTRTGSLSLQLPPGDSVFPIVVGLLPVGAYSATVTVRHFSLGTQLAAASLAFDVIAPYAELALAAGAGEPDSLGQALVQITVSNAAAGYGVWRGSLNLAGALNESAPLAVAPCQWAIVTRTLDLAGLAGPQTIVASAIAPDGSVVASGAVTVTAAPRAAPLASLAGLAAGPALAGGPVVVTATVSNDGPAGEVALQVVIFDQTYELIRTVAGGGASTLATLAVTTPGDLLDGAYPISARLGDQELRGEIAVTGPRITIANALDAAGYAPFTAATWTITLRGVSGGPASYDVGLRYGLQAYTQTVTLAAGQTAVVPWSFDVGAASDRASVLVENHPADPTQPRHTLVIDSRWVNVIEDVRAWLESDRNSYDAGDTVHLTLHLLQPTNSAMVLAPDNLVTPAGPLVWSLLSITPTLPITAFYTTGDFTMSYGLPAVAPTGRYYFTYFFDGEERTLPVDVHGVTLVADRFGVSLGGVGGGLVTAARSRSGDFSRPVVKRTTEVVTTKAAPAAIASGVHLTITARLSVNQPVASAEVRGSALAPSGAVLSLGPSAAITLPLPAGVTFVTLTGTLNPTEPGAHRITLKVRDTVSGVNLGGEAAFVDAGYARIGSLTTNRGVYAPGDPGVGTVTVYGNDTATVQVVTSDHTPLLSQTAAVTGFVTLTFAIPTATERDEVLIGTVTDSAGFTSTLQAAYRVAASFDVTPPQVQIVSPTAAQVLPWASSSPVITVTGVVTEDVALGRVLVNGVAATVAPSTTTVSTWQAPLLLQEGLNWIEVATQDAAGNIGLPAAMIVIAEPSYGISLSVAPTHTLAGQLITYTAVLTASDLLTGTVVFPFSMEAISPTAGSATAGALSLSPLPVTWQGLVTPAAAVTLTWTGLATAAITRTIYAFANGPQTDTSFSNAVDTEVGPCDAPAALTDVRAARGSGSSVVLTWTGTGAAQYEVWRGVNTPYFAPGWTCAGAPDCAIVTENSYTLDAALGDPNGNVYFLVIARAACGAASGASKRTGGFSFRIAPGE